MFIINGKEHKTADCKVSVIIPVFNTEKYLCKCLDSIQNQTLKEIEIICVDDGSSDRSLDILNEYAENDSRVIVLSQLNTNAGAARNNGMRIARGDYLVFLDSDDWFEANMLELAYNRIREFDSDICIWAGDEFFENGSKQDNYGFLVENLISKEPFNYLDANDCFFSISNPAPWTKMYKTQFIKQYSLQFQEIKFSNDVYFTSAAFALAGSIVSVRKKLIHYRRDSSNNLSSKRSTAPLLFTESLLALREKLIIENRYEKLRSAFVNFALSVSEFNLKKLDMLSSSFKDIANEFVGRYLDELDLLSCNSSRCTSLLKMMFGEMSNVPPRKVIEGTQLKAAVSIVIPVYNTEKYLRECLDSVVNQTYMNIEIICVDDGSTDNSLSILQEYAEKDNRICIISEINGGLSCARNRGIANASGEYIYCMDSDDCLTNDAIEKLYNMAKTENDDIILFDRNLFFESSEMERQFSDFKQVQSYPSQITDKVFENGIALLKALLDINCFHPCVPFLFINRSFLLDSNMRFYEGIMHEDELFTPLVLTKAVRVKCICDKLYLRRVRSNSIMTSSDNTEFSIISLFTVAVELFSRGVVDSNNVTIDGKNLLIQYAEKILGSAKNKYRLLDTSQRAEIKKRVPIDCCRLFEMCIENSELTQTKSFIIGRAITWFPRKARAGLNCIKEKGFRYTFILLVQKMKRKFNMFSRFMKQLHENSNKLHAYYCIGGTRLVRKVLKRKVSGTGSYEECIYESNMNARPADYPSILKGMYYLRTGNKLPYDNPQNYTEKMQYAKISDNLELKTTLTDKFLVRDWVREKIGDEYLIPLLGAWEKFDDIDFGQLPQRFVLKSNTGSGWNYFVRNGVSDSDKKRISELCAYWNSTIYAYFGMELQYKNIKPVIIAEELIGPESGIQDYKFLCFDGQPYYCWVDIDRYGNHKRNIYDLDWNLQPWNQYTYGNTNTPIPKPKNFEKMIEIVTALAQGFSHVRVDLYNDDGKIYFGEMTFTNGAGYEMIYPEEYNKALGDLWNLSLSV